MLGLGRAQAAEAIGGGRGDAAAEGGQKLLRHGVRGNADADAVLAAGDDVVDVVGLWQDQGQRPRPELGGQLLRQRRHGRHPAVQIARIVQVHDHRMIRRASLHLENLAHRRRIRGIGAEPVDGLGREDHQTRRRATPARPLRFQFVSLLPRRHDIKTRIPANAASPASRGNCVAVPVFLSHFCPDGRPATGLSSKGPLEKREVEPAPELESDFVKVARDRKAHARCKPIEAALSASMPAIITCFFEAFARSIRASNSVRPMPRLRRSARTCRLCSTLNAIARPGAEIAEGAESPPPRTPRAPR